MSEVVLDASLNQISTEDVVNKLAQEAKEASYILAQTSGERINAVLDSLSIALRDSKEIIIHANEKDILAAHEKGLSEALIDRLMLNEDRIESIAQGIKNVRNLDNPTDRILWEQNRQKGLKI